MGKTVKEYKDDIWFYCTMGKDLKKAEQTLQEAIKEHPDKKDELIQHYNREKGFSVLFQ